MESVTFINSLGESVYLGEDAPFVLIKIEGTGATDVYVQTQKSPFQDGTTYIDNTLEPRTISIELRILAENENEMVEYRHRLLQAFNPKLGLGELKYQFGNVTRRIKAIAEFPPTFPHAGDFKDTMQPSLIQLYCPDPYWYELDEEIWGLKSFEGGFEFPFSFSVSFGTVGTKLTIKNEGDVKTPIFFELFGPMVNPILNNETTGESLTVTQELLENEKLEINTAFGQKSVVKVDANGARTNAFHYVSATSKFFNLIPGDNVLSYTATGTTAESNAVVRFRNRYLGV